MHIAAYTNDVALDFNMVSESLKQSNAVCAL